MSQSPVALLAVATEDFMEAAILGLALSYSFSLTSNLKFATRMMAATEANMNATERVKYVIRHCFVIVIVIVVVVVVVIIVFIGNRYE